MATTNFSNGVTLTDAGWFNDVDAAVYEGTLPSGATALTVTGATTLAVYNTIATTVNAFGAASTALNIGHASAAAAFAGGISIPTGKNVTGTGTAQVTGFATVSATTLTGTLSTAAQTNITSVGTLTGLVLGGNVTESGGARSITVTGNITGAAISGTTLTASGNIVLPDAALIRLATVDGSDTGQLYLAAASADGPTRGAHVQLFGNERATFGGQLYLNAGDVSGGNIYLRTGNGIVGLQVDRGAGGSVAGAVTIPGTLGVTGLASYANNIASTGGQAPVIGTTAAVLMGYGGSQPSVHFVDTARTTNNKRAELHFSGGSVIGRWVNDDYNAATTWLQVTGGYGAGTTSVKLPSLAGTGTRAVVVDANGVLSAP